MTYETDAKPMGHFVYLIANDDERTKVGHSSSPKRRLSDLQTASATVLELVCSWEFSTRERAVAFEAAAHRILKWSHAVGEWHRLAPERVCAVLDAAFAGEHERANSLCETFKNLREAEVLEACGENDEDRELWAGVQRGYLQRASWFGYQPTGWDALSIRVASR